MVKTTSDVDWEIKQTLLAIDYYIRAIEDSTNEYDALKYEECVNNLRNHLMSLYFETDSENE